MKKLKLLPILLACLMALAFISCEDSINAPGGGGTGGTGGTGTGDVGGGGPERSLTFAGQCSLNGNNFIELTFSNNSLVNHERTFWISSGHSYVLRVNGVVWERGSVSWVNGLAGFFEGEPSITNTGGIYFNRSYLRSENHVLSTARLQRGGSLIVVIEERDYEQNRWRQYAATSNATPQWPVVTQ